MSSRGSICWNGTQRDARGSVFATLNPPFEQHPLKLLVSLAIDLAPTTLAIDLHGRRKARQFVPSTREFPRRRFCARKIVEKKATAGKYHDDRLASPRGLGAKSTRDQSRDWGCDERIVWLLSRYFSFFLFCFPWYDYTWYFLVTGWFFFLSFSSSRERRCSGNACTLSQVSGYCWYLHEYKFTVDIELDDKSR